MNTSVQAADIEQVPGHFITVTGGGPFGRAWFECSCGIERRFASKRSANGAALAHFETVGGALPVGAA